MTAWLAVLLLAGSSMAQPTERGIRCAYWRETPGATVADLTSLPSFPALPSEQLLLPDLELPENQEANFGTLLRGLVHPQQQGAYRFYIAGNGQCELWLSEDETPAKVKLIAAVPTWTMPRQWRAHPQQESGAIELLPHRQYYIEVRHKNGGGDNHLSVAWKLPDGEMEAPIPAARLTPAPAVSVPPPAIKLPAPLPLAPGRHQLSVRASYRGQELELPVLLRVPAASEERRRGLLFLPAADLETPAFEQGPSAALADPPCTVVVLSPPEGRALEERDVTRSIAAAARELVAALQISPDAVALSGNSGGAIAGWKLVQELPGFFRTFAPIGGMESLDAGLAQQLRGTRVRIYTDIREGFATECADRMRDRLASLSAPPEVVYLGEAEVGEATAADYCYRSRAFYDRLFTDPPPAGVAVAPVRNWPRIAALAIAAGVAVYGLWRIRCRCGG
jgi:hypothetical protein